MNKRAKGDAFVREKTGSATMINLDGKWEHDFYDDPTLTGENPGDRPAGKENQKK